MDAIPETDDDSAPSPRFVTTAPRLKHETTSVVGRARMNLLATLRDHCMRHDAAHMEDDLVQLLDGFFEGPLSLAVQDRETKYLNTMTEVFRDELKERTHTIARVTEKCALLEARVAECDVVTDGLRSSLDRRSYEMDALRKAHYKEILMLRELVTRQKTDPATLRALDEAIAGLHLQRRRMDAAKSEETSPRKASVAADEPSMDDRIELLKKDLEKRKQFNFVLRQDRDKWEERTREARAELDALRKSLETKPDLPATTAPLPTTTTTSMPVAPWWTDGASGGRRERLAIDSAVSAHTVALRDVAAAMIEVMALPEVWSEVTTILTDPMETSKAAAHLSSLVQALTPEPAPDTILEVHLPPPKSAPSPPTRSASRVPCLQCNGLGIIDPATVSTTVDVHADAQLQRSLQRLQELKREVEQRQDEVTQLQAANTTLTTQQTTLTATVTELRAQLAAIPKPTRSSSKAEATTATDASRAHHSVSVQTDTVVAEALKHIEPTPTPVVVDGARTEALEALLRDQAVLVSDLQGEIYTKDDVLRTLQENVSAAEASLLKVRHASEVAQQLLRDEITVLSDTLSALREDSTVAMRDKQAALTSYLAQLSTRAMLPSTPLENAAEIDIASLIPWSDDDTQAETLARVTEAAAQQTEVEWTDLQRAFAASPLPAMPLDAARANPVESILTLQAELELQKESTQKVACVQMQRIVTLSSHLARLAGEMLTMRKRLLAQVAFWKTECEKLERGQICLLTEFNCYKTNYLVQAEVLKMRAAASESQETQWSTINDDIQEFLRTLSSHAAATPHDAWTWFTTLSNTIAAASDDTKQRSFEALVSLYHAWTAKRNEVEPPVQATNKQQRKPSQRKPEPRQSRSQSTSQNKSPRPPKQMLYPDEKKTHLARLGHTEAKLGHQRVAPVARAKTESSSASLVDTPPVAIVPSRNDPLLLECVLESSTASEVMDDDPPSSPLPMNDIAESQIVDDVFSIQQVPDAASNEVHPEAAGITDDQAEEEAPEELSTEQMARATPSQQEYDDPTKKASHFETTFIMAADNETPDVTAPLRSKAPAPPTSPAPLTSTAPLTSPGSSATLLAAPLCVLPSASIYVPSPWLPETVVTSKANASPSSKIQAQDHTLPHPTLAPFADGPPTVPPTSPPKRRSSRLPAEVKLPTSLVVALPMLTPLVVSTSPPRDKTAHETPRMLPVDSEHAHRLRDSNQLEHESVAELHTMLEIRSLQPVAASKGLAASALPSPVTTELEEQEALPETEPRLVALPPMADPHHHAKGLNYLRTLVRARRDVMSSLSVLNWSTLAAHAAVRRLQARVLEAKAHHTYHHNQRDSHWSSLLQVMQKALRTKERLRTQVLERRGQMRSHLDQTNAAILHALSSLFQDDKTVSDPLPAARGLMPLDLNLVDLGVIPPSQQIPTPHYPLHPHYPTDPYTGLMSVERVAPGEPTQRFPSRTLKFRSDPTAGDFSLLHVVKARHPRSAGPPGKAVLDTKSAVRVSAFRVSEATTTIVASDAALQDIVRSPISLETPRHPNPYRPKSTPSYRSRFSSRQTKPAPIAHPDPVTLLTKWK
ncbi:hypothetical protein SDRG_03779 [Saprolegnia diclina VS20]|uniref:Uncharacterized protein n=1 Tax=Saprolegnia diclina (strain VS20) TaxID=1156394 RepID=T0QXM8_SAPDV|nr:hypothetical protein SDRG_03779 [Saprolegnia diclina VS20]EQC38820.1 hypothetical protein SDRG_03779 [Saprolegnia diclina VS20]|eukprot:XP_008607644.1 hypothetical protein SDRG_03779 [Saprolegnia diclina VS20]